MSNDLENLIRALRGTAAVGIVVASPQKVKVNCPFGKEIIKVARHSGLLGANYQNAVNNQRVREDKEPDFESEALPWGQHDGPYFIAHNGFRYLKLYKRGESQTEYHLKDGSLVDYELIKPYFYAKQEGERQGLDDPRKWRTPRLDHIRVLRLNKQEYRFFEEDDDGVFEKFLNLFAEQLKQEETSVG